MWSNPQFPTDTFTEEILNGILYFSCSVIWISSKLITWISSVKKFISALTHFFQLFPVGPKTLRQSMCLWIFHSCPTFYTYPIGIYLFKVNNRHTKIKWEICWTLTIKTPQRRQWRCFGIFIVDFEHVSHFVLVFLLLTLSR